MAGAVRSARIFSRELGLREVEAEGFAFAYRSCRLKGNDSGGDFLVTEVALDLVREKPGRIRERMDAVFRQKQAGQPMSARSAGCVFKNPHPEHPAGRLLEEAGLRGKQCGGMRFSPVHANFLENAGQESFSQAEELIALAREAVERRSGFFLELEVRVWP
jgi:UDP-N-acetylmuramate dehydrogenase